MRLTLAKIHPRLEPWIDLIWVFESDAGVPETSSPRFFQEDLLDLYYDQAHFSREFKRFTGVSPGRYAQSDNEFGRIFYKRQDP